MFGLDSLEWRCLRNREVLALVDESPWSMPQFERDGETFRGGVTETMVASLPPVAIDAFAAARRVRFRVCGDVCELNPAQMETLRRFAAQRRGTEAEAPPGVPGAPARADVLAALQRVQALAVACLPEGVSRMRMTYGGAGNLLGVEPLDGATPDAASCVRRHAEGAEFPRFGSPDFVVSFPFHRP